MARSQYGILWLLNQCAARSQYGILWLLILASGFEVNMRPLCFQTKMSVVFQIRESVVLFVMN